MHLLAVRAEYLAECVLAAADGGWFAYQIKGCILC